MKKNYVLQFHKIIKDSIEVPDNLLEGKPKEEWDNVFKALIVQKYKPLLLQGHFILEDEIEFYDEETNN